MWFEKELVLKSAKAEVRVPVAAIKQIAVGCQKGGRGNVWAAGEPPVAVGQHEECSASFSR